MVSCFKAAKLNQVSDGYCADLSHEPKAVPEVFAKNIDNEFKLKNSNNAVGCENVMRCRDVTANVVAYPHNSTDIPKFKKTHFESKIYLQNMVYHQDRKASLTADHQHLNNIGQMRCLKTSREQLKQQIMQKDWRIATMTLALVMGFFITLLPFAVSRLVTVFGKSSLTPTIYVYASVCTAISSVINPYLILATRKDIRGVFCRRQ